MVRKSVAHLFSRSSASSPAENFAPLPPHLIDPNRAQDLRQIYLLARQQAEEQVARERAARRERVRWN